MQEKYNLQNDFLDLQGKSVKERQRANKEGFIVGANIKNGKVLVKWRVMKQSRKSWVDFDDLEVLN